MKIKHCKKYGFSMFLKLLFYDLQQILRFVIENNVIFARMGKLTFLHFIISVLLLLAVPVGALSNEQLSGAALWLKQKGDACYNAGRYPEALDYYTQGLDRAKSDGEDSIYYACTGNIGNIYAVMEDYRHALHYYLKGYQASADRGDKEMQWSFATNIVAVYCRMGKVDDARVFFKQQMNIGSADVTRNKYHSLSNQAQIAIADGDYKMAEYYIKEAIDYATAKGLSAEYKVSPYMNLAEMKFDHGDMRAAFDIYRQCADSLKSRRDLPMLVGIYKKMYEASMAMGDTAEADMYRHKYLSLSDSVFNTSQFNIAAGKLFEYENAETQKRVDSLVHRNRAQLIVIAVFVVLVAALALLYVTLRRKNRMLLDARQTLMRKNEELTAGDRRQKKLLEQYVAALNNLENHTVDNSGAVPEQLAEPIADDSLKKQQGISLGEEQRNRLLNSITSILENVEVIARSDFNLNMLADMVGTNTKYVSWVINDTYGKNFKTLLNEYRIREACRRMADREHYANVTIQTIYEELGYSSAAGFINAFRNVNGMTPSAYLKLVSRH